MERFLMEYLANSIWQVPLVAAGAWLALRVLHPGPTAQHRIWLGALMLMLAMPVLTHRSTSPPIVPAPAAALFTENVPPDTLAPATRINMATADQSADQNTDQSTTLITDPEPTAQSPTDAPVHTSRFAMYQMTLTPTATHGLVGLYLAAIAFMAMRLLGSAWASYRLTAQAMPAALSDTASDQLDQCCERFAVTRPKVLICPHTSSPMVVGAIRPSLVLPQSFAARLENPAPHLEHELEAVWLHELAHLQRRDHLTNLICRIASLPIAYHPAAHAVQQRIRQTREMVCDEMAATAMQSPLGYARCLVGLARTIHAMTPRIEAVGMFNDGVLEERIMQLTKTKTTLSARTRTVRFAVGAAMMLAVLAAPALFHVTPTLAQAASPAPPETAASAPAPAAAPATVPQSPDQTLPAAPAKADTPAAPSVGSAGSAETRKNLAEAKAANAENKATTTESRIQLEDARKRLDDAAKTYGDLAAKSAEASGKSAEADTPEFKQQMEDARKQLSEATDAFNDQIAKTVDSTIRVKVYKIDSAELSKRMAEAQAKLNSPEFKAQIAEAQAKFSSPEFKEKMQKLNQQMAEAQAKFSSPEFKAQIAKLNSPEFKKQMEEAQARFNSPEFKEKTEKMARQMAEAQAKLNSPEFKAKIEKLNSPEFKKQMEEAQSKFENDRLRQMDILSDDISRQMDEVRSQIDEALRLWTANAPTR